MIPVPASDLPANVTSQSGAVPHDDLPDHLARAAPKPSFPQDDPAFEYGSVLPLAKNKETGALSLAVPEMIRQPVRGLEQMGERLKGPLTPDKMHGLGPDEQAAFLALGGVRPSVVPSAEAAASAVRPSALAARQAGYVLPPASISEKPGLVSNVLAGWSGKIKTQQAASAKNQSVTNELAATALGLPKDTVLTDEILHSIRTTAGKAYQAVADSVPVIQADEAYSDTVATLGGKNSHAAKLFPKITNNPGIQDMVGELSEVKEFPTTAGLELVKELRFNATQNLKALGDPSKHALGLAQREAANAVDDLMERNIAATGEDGVVEAYKQARRLIAKSYDVEGVTNTATGDVNARGLARLADKGRPLTDELKTIADAASAFPKAMQAPSGFGDNEPWSALDFFGSAAAMAHGNPSVAATILARPVARSAVLSNRYQNSMATPFPPGRSPLYLPAPWPQQPDPAQSLGIPPQ